MKLSLGSLRKACAALYVGPTNKLSVFLVSLWTPAAMYLAGREAIHLGAPLALGILVAGVVAVFLNFDSDRQRQVVRAANGNAMVWGKARERARPRGRPIAFLRERTAVAAIGHFAHHATLSRFRQRASHRGSVTPSDTVHGSTFDMQHNWKP